MVSLVNVCTSVQAQQSRTTTLAIDALRLMGREDRAVAVAMTWFFGEGPFG